MRKDRFITALEQIRDIVEQALSGDAADSGSTPSASKKRFKKTSPPESSGAISFSLNTRAFMKKYAKGLSGSQKFTLLAAHLAKGKLTFEISSDKLTAEWNRMKSVIGGAFNTAHATRAKESGWIDSPKRGVYVLSATWKEALGTE